MNVTKKQAYIIGGIALVGLGVGAYFLFKKDDGEYDEKAAEKQANAPEVTVGKTGVKVKATPEYKNELLKYAKSTELKETTRALLSNMNMSWIGRDKEQIKSLIYDRIPSDDHMKILKAYFHCHRFNHGIYNKCWDLTSWLKHALGSDDWNAMTLKYPSLQIPTVCYCKKKIII